MISAKLYNKLYRTEQTYYQTNTKNFSFIKMATILERLGIKNNKFFLVLYDKELMNVNPFSDKLSFETKARIVRECQRNYWYFVREIVRIPVAGGIKRYQLHRANLAMGFCFTHNINQYVEMPRQNGKSVAGRVWYLWIYQFGTVNSEFLFMNKQHADAKMNLKEMRAIRDALPDYLKFSDIYDDKGKKLKTRNNVETAVNGKTNNTIVTKPSAASEVKADEIGRGCTQPSQWYVIMPTYMVTCIVNSL